MEICKEMHVCDAKQPVQSEESGNVICDESAAAAAAAATLEHLEDDDDEDFEDAVDNLTLDSFNMADERDVVSQCYDMSAEHEVDSFHPSSNKLQDVKDKVLTDEMAADARVAMPGSCEDISDSRHSSLCEDAEVASEKQEAASDTAIVDEEVLRERESCLTDEEKQVIC